VHVRNTNRQTNVAAHAVVVDPVAECIYEAFKRSTDSQWLIRTYRPVFQSKVEKTAETGPDWLLHDTNRSNYIEIERGPDGSVAIAQLIESGELALPTRGL
jgi:hypothetical protein